MASNIQIRALTKKRAVDFLQNGTMNKHELAVSLAQINNFTIKKNVEILDELIEFGSIRQDKSGWLSAAKITQTKQDTIEEAENILSGLGASQ